MADYRPPTRFDTPMTLLIPTYSRYNGVEKKVYPETGNIIMVSFRSFGGTETTVNGVLSVENTATVETWYNPAIKSDCRLQLNGRNYEILGDPENINCRNQFLRFKVRAVGGGV